MTERAVVVGAGVMGAWTALWLRRRGLDVTLLDAYGAGNSLASSGDETRVTRSAHGTDAHYAGWQRRALEHWRELERRRGERLYVPTGVLWLARAEVGVEADSHATLAALGVPVERLSAVELASRWPQITADDLAWGLYEPEGGALMARRGVAAVARALEQEGGRYRRARLVRDGGAGSPPAAGVALSDGSALQADVVVFACGAWLAGLFPELLGDGQLLVTRQEVVYFSPPPGDGRFDAGSLPIWVDYAAAVYGLPSIEGRGLKAAPDRPGPPVDPDHQERLPSPAVVEAAREYVRRRFPDMAGRPVGEVRVCQYESTPDAHFIIDRLPVAGQGDAWIVGGGSGHGYKHGPVIGEYLAALVTGDSPAASALAPPDDRFRLRQRVAAGIGLRTAGAES